MSESHGVEFEPDASQLLYMINWLRYKEHERLMKLFMDSMPLSNVEIYIESTPNGPNPYFEMMKEAQTQKSSDWFQLKE